MKKDRSTKVIAAEMRGARRHRLSLEAQVYETGAGARAATIANISETGCLVELQDAGVARTEVSIEIIGLDIPPVDARVTWHGDAAFGCVFDEPLGAATVSAARLRGDPPSERTSQRTDWAERLVAARKRLAISASAMARELGISRPTLWAWETGRSAPSVENAGRVEDWLSQAEPPLPAGNKAGELGSRVDALRAQVADVLGVEPGDIDISLRL